jgi:LAO/AO transport system kinase
MSTIKQLILGLYAGDQKSLARCITIVENEMDGYEELLTSLKFKKNVPVIGITGPPGAGKSTLINSIIKNLTQQKKQIGIVAIDPTSPFNYGSLLGDRLRMSEHFLNENIYIRSLATRGALGGLSAKTIEVIDVLRAFNFDYIFIETVGVGQSEVEIAGLADTTVLVLVPESGDEIQTIKSGIMEIADIFVVNKSDREGAAGFSKNIHELLQSKKSKDWTCPVINAIASADKGTDEIIKQIEKHRETGFNKKRSYLYTEKAYRLIQNQRMKNINKKELHDLIEKALVQKDFNLYSFVKKLY